MKVDANGNGLNTTLRTGADGARATAFFCRNIRLIGFFVKFIPFELTRVEIRIPNY